MAKANFQTTTAQYEKNLASVTSEQAVIDQIKQDHQAQVTKLNADF